MTKSLWWLPALLAAAMWIGCVEVGAFVVRCRHDQGHVILSSEVEVAAQWMFAHVYGVASPFVEAGIDDFGEWCEVVD